MSTAGLDGAVGLNRWPAQLAGRPRAPASPAADSERENKRESVRISVSVCVCVCLSVSGREKEREILTGQLACLITLSPGAEQSPSPF